MDVRPLLRVLAIVLLVIAVSLGLHALAFLTHRTTGTCLFFAGSVLILLTIYQVSYGMPLIRIAGVMPSTTPALGWNAEHVIAYYYEVIISTGFGLMLLGASYGGRQIRAVLGFTPLRIIGIVSYSIYLLHMPLLHNVMRTFLALHQTQHTLFVKYLLTLLAEVVPLAIVLYLVVERPRMRWARQRTSHKN